jgi:hypothetical protein
MYCGRVLLCFHTEKKLRSQFQPMEILLSLLFVLSARVRSNRETRFICVHSEPACKKSLKWLKRRLTSHSIYIYEGIYEGAKKEATERMRMGFFAGGVALLGRLAVWNDEVDAWSRWKQKDLEVEGDWLASVKRVVGMVRAGEINGGGCGC